jgi:hypothetical protein
VLADLEGFVNDHRPHGRIEAAVGDLTANGYMLEAVCACGVTFYRWVAPIDAEIDLALLARLS